MRSFIRVFKKFIFLVNCSSEHAIFILNLFLDISRTIQGNTSVIGVGLLSIQMDGSPLVEGVAQGNARFRYSDSANGKPWFLPTRANSRNIPTIHQFWPGLGTYLMTGTLQSGTLQAGALQSILPDLALVLPLTSPSE